MAENKKRDVSEFLTFIPDENRWYNGVRGNCETCKHRDKYGICTKIRDIFGYELIVENECIFSDNFTFTEVD